MPLFALFQNNICRGWSCKRKVSQKKLWWKKPRGGGADLAPPGQLGLRKSFSHILYIELFKNLSHTFSSLVVLLLKRMHTDCAQTLSDATPPVGKVHPFSKMAITFTPILKFLCPLRFRNFPCLCHIVYIKARRAISNFLGVRH